MSDSTPASAFRGAVFLSYASQDAVAARRICEALRAAGVEVWFDLNELRGGDAWDQKIRRQIKECTLFMPVISANTNARPEGYFRLEWKLAVDRSHLMSDDHPFLFPVVIDDTTDAAARVPDRFREVQWTRLDIKDTPESLAARVAKLLGGAEAAERSHADERGGGAAAPRKSGASWFGQAAAIMALLVGGAYALKPLWTERRTGSKPPASANATPAPAAAPQSEARKLVEKARAMTLDKYESSADDYATAEGLLKQALTLDQNDAEIWAFSSLFNTAIRTRGFDHAPARREMARRDAERALKLAPDSISALFALGRAQRDLERATAEKAFNQILARDPNHAGALGNLASIYDVTGRVEEAAALYERTVVADPAQAALTRYLQYLLYFHYSRFEEAERAVRQSIAIQPGANSQGGLAMVLLTGKGDADEAARVLATGPTATRNEPRTIWTTALVQLCRRAPDDVLKTLDRLADDYIQDNWFSGPKGYFAGRAHALAGRTEAARAAWESALAITNTRLKSAPDDTYHHLMRGQLVAFLGQADEALREARTVQELLRKETPYWFGSPVLIYAALGRADDALPLLQKLCNPPAGMNVGWPLTPALLRLDPLWDKLRDDPRFQKLVASDRASTTAAPAPPLSPARELVAKARDLYRTIDGTREDFALAEDYCERALKLDSTDGEVWATASQLNSAFVYRGFDPTPERREKCRTMAERAIRLAPTSTEAKVAQAGAWSLFNVNQAQTEKLLREVVQERPGDQNALRFLAVTLLSRPGGLEECLAINERSAALPGGDALALYNNARYLWQRNRPEEAYATMQRSMAQKPFSSSLVFATMMEIGWRGDLAAAAATLRKIPPSFLLEDRANYHAGLLAYYQRRSDEALRTWTSFPRDFYNDFNYDGPKSYLTGLAYELDHRDEAARLEWRAALQAVEKRLATASNNVALLYYKATLLSCLGEKKAAEETLRTYEQLFGFKNTPDALMLPGHLMIYLRLGRIEEAMAHLPASLAQSGTSGLWPARLRLDPRFDALRSDPRFEKLLAQYPPPAAEAKK